ncbi:MAG: ABC transporter ATP-binding protein, partial [Verrucomicrobiae bacterium]|nr:ABC transporter ATP-binding protein [Verrucomicrobiae bacterium]
LQSPDCISIFMTIRAENVSKSYGKKQVLRDLSFEAESGTFLTLLGSTGSGKTTLLRILAGIEKPDRGRIYFDGIDVTDIPVQRRNIAFVYQQFVNYPSMTVFENIASPLRVAKEKHTEAAIKANVLEAAELLRLTGVLHYLPEEVSGGQRQRCAIARALVKGSRYMFLDEPLANLDYKLREELRMELKQIFRDRGGVVVYATPEPIDALMMASHVGFLHEGNLLQYGEVLDVYKHPCHAAVGSYFCQPQMNLFPCMVRGQGDRSRIQVSPELQFEIALGKEVLPANSYLLGFRPHHLHLADPEKRMVPFQARVELSEVVDSNTELHLQHGELRLTLLMQEITPFAVGQEITAFIDPEHLYIFDVESGTFVARTTRDKHQQVR